MEGLVATVAVATEERKVVFLNRPVGIYVSLVFIQPSLIFVNEALSSVQLTGHL